MKDEGWAIVQALTQPALYLRAAEIVEAGWSQKCQACDVDGFECGVFAPQAVRFSITGAIVRAAAEQELYCYSLLPACKVIGLDLTSTGMACKVDWFALMLWNIQDGRTVAEVAQALRDAAEVPFWD